MTAFFAHNLTPEKIISRLPAGALLAGLLLGILRMLIALTEGATISAETLTVYVLSGLNAGFLLAGMLAYFVLIGNSTAQKSRIYPLLAVLPFSVMVTFLYDKLSAPSYLMLAAGFFVSTGCFALFLVYIRSLSIQSTAQAPRHIPEVLQPHTMLLLGTGFGVGWTLIEVLLQKNPFVFLKLITNVFHYLSLVTIISLSFAYVHALGQYASTHFQSLLRRFFAILPLSLLPTSLVYFVIVDLLQHHMLRALYGYLILLGVFVLTNVVFMLMLQRLQKHSTVY